MNKSDAALLLGILVTIVMILGLVAYLVKQDQAHQYRMAQEGYTYVRNTYIKTANVQKVDE